MISLLDSISQINEYREKLSLFLKKSIEYNAYFHDQLSLKANLIALLGRE